MRKYCEKTPNKYLGVKKENIVKGVFPPPAAIDPSQKEKGTAVLPSLPMPLCLHYSLITGFSLPWCGYPTSQVPPCLVEPLRCLKMDC